MKKYFVFLFFLLVFSSSVFASPVVNIVSPYADQENNRLVPLFVNATTFDSGQSITSVIYNWNGTNYTYTQGQTAYVYVPFGTHTFKVWASQTDTNITLNQVTVTASFVSPNGAAVVVGFIAIMIFFAYLGVSLNEDHTALAIAFVSLSFAVGLTIVNTAHQLLIKQYDDAVFAGSILTWNTVYISILVLLCGYFVLFIFFSLMNRWKKQQANDKSKREQELYGEL